MHVHVLTHVKRIDMEQARTVTKKLYKKDSKGKTRVWYAEQAGSAYTTYSGVAGGSLISKTYTPTAKGRNTTTEQATKDMLSRERKKYERELYIDDETCTKAHPLAFTAPMLARDYTKVGHQVDWSKNEYVAQAKLNGVRCIAQLKNGAVELTSRKGKVYAVPHIQNMLMEQVYEANEANEASRTDLVLDGELYIHGVELGDVSHAVACGSALLEYHAFDTVDSEEPFSERHSGLVCLGLKGHLRVVPAVALADEEALKKMHHGFVQGGYEGIMLRDVNSLYEVGKRSLSLFKYKTFQDSEFDVVSVEQDIDGGAILVLVNNAGAQFRSRPMGSNALRKNLWDKRVSLLGESVTVKYSSLLATGTPEFGRVLVKGVIRDYE